MLTQLALMFSSAVLVDD